MKLVAQVQILDEAVSISLYANALEKGLDPFIFSPAIGK